MTTDKKIAFISSIAACVVGISLVFLAQKDRNKEKPKVIYTPNHINSYSIESCPAGTAGWVDCDEFFCCRRNLFVHNCALVNRESINNSIFVICKGENHFIAFIPPDVKPDWDFNKSRDEWGKHVVNYSFIKINRENLASAFEEGILDENLLKEITKETIIR